MLLNTARTHKAARPHGRVCMMMFRRRTCRPLVPQVEAVVLMVEALIRAVAVRSINQIRRRLNHQMLQLMHQLAQRMLGSRAQTIVVEAEAAIELTTPTHVEYHLQLTEHLIAL